MPQNLQSLTCVCKVGGVYDVNPSSCGYLNGIKSAVKLDNGAGGMMITKEWVITGECSDVCFSYKGHSGTFVVAERSLEVMGKIIGGTEGFPSLTYITDFGDEMADIRRVSGGNVYDLA